MARLLARSLAVHRSLLWLAIVVLLLILLAFRLQLSFDLGAFLPRHGGPAAEVLLQQLGSGPGSRLMVLGISGGDDQQRQDASRMLQAALSERPEFVQVLNGESGPAGDAVPEPIRSQYPLMTSLDYSAAALGEAVQLRLQDLALGGGASLRQLVAADPYLASLLLLQKLAPTETDGELWQASDGSLVLLAETLAAGTDLNAQEEALAATRAIFAELPSQQQGKQQLAEQQLPGQQPTGQPDLKLDVTGVGPFGVELRQSIQAEATLRSILASIAVVLVLLLLYRSLRLLLLVALPVVVGLLAGLAAVSLFFDSVHGITLAFGFTLMGVAVDFPLHLFSHHRSNEATSSSGSDPSSGPSSNLAGFWRTLWLGAGSTAIAYLAMLFSGASGLAQLGLFSAVGVTTAVLVTRHWLPSLLPAAEPSPAEPSTPLQTRLRFTPLALALIAVLGLLAVDHKKLVWDDQLSSLSPVGADRITRDGQLRSASATFDMRYQLRLQAASLEELLLQCEQLENVLSAARDDGLLSAWSSPCLLLPSQQLQAQRKAQIPLAEEMQQRMQQALQDSPFKAEAFQPFEQTLQSAQASFPLKPADFEQGPLAAWLGAHLLQIDEQWFALVNLADPQAEALAARIKPLAPAVSWMDLQQSSTQMMQDFRHEATRAVALAALAILLMLALARTRPRRLLWIVLTALASLGLTLAVIILVHHAINLVHLVALLLVLGLGLDYSLFLSREDSNADPSAARHSITACALSTTLAFGILAGSSIPMLSFIGLTVATGSFSAFVLAMLGSRQRPLPAAA